MQERLRNFGISLLNRWNAFERGQKIKIIVTVLVLLTTLAATVFITTRTKWTTIINGRSWSEIGLIENTLTNEGFTTRQVENGTGIAVREQDKSSAMIALSSSTALNNMDFTFEDALNASGMGSTERIKQEAFQRVFESDLAYTLSLIDWIDSAKINIVPTDENNLFVRSEDRPSASVWLVTNRTPDDAQAASVARMIMRAVKNLSMDDIEITDQHANTLYSGMAESMGTAGSEQDIRRQRELEVDTKVRNLMMPIFDEVKTYPRLTLDWNQTESETTTIQSPNPDDPATGVPRIRSTESSSATGGSNDAEPGAMQNDNATTTYETGTTNQQSAQSRSEDVEYAYNESKTRTVTGMGDVILDNSSLSVVAIKHRHHYQETMQNNDQLGEQSWEEFVDETSRLETPLTIDPNLIENLRNATGLTNLSVIGYEVPVFHDYEAPPSRWQEYVIFAILALLILLLALGMLRRTQADEVIELEPELTVEDLLVSTQLEEEKESLPELEPISIVNESETVQQINKFIDDRPEVVASLLRNWLNEDWE